MVILGCGVFGIVMALVLRGSGDLAPASAAEPGYLLRSFEITYPYDDPRIHVGRDSKTADVSFGVTWASGRYPGNVSCEIVLRDEAGQEVGRLPFELDNATDGSRAPSMRIDVSAPPNSAEGSCGSANYDSGPGYIFSDLISKTRSGGPGEMDGTRLSFDVEWARGSSVDPGMRTCYLDVIRRGGSQDAARRLDVNIGEGRQILIVPGNPESVEDASVACGPLEE